MAILDQTKSLFLDTLCLIAQMRFLGEKKPQKPTKPKNQDVKTRQA